MIVASVNNDETKRSLLVCIIEDINLDRMRKADPQIIKPSMYVTPKYPDSFEIMLAYEQMNPVLATLVRKNDLIGLVTYLVRGYDPNERVEGVVGEIKGGGNGRQN